MSRARRAGLWLVLTLGALLVALLIGLGVWQLQRRVWKLDLIAAVERNVHAAPVAPPATAGGTDLYRRIRLHGRFRHAAETRVHASTEHGLGYWLLTPLEDGGGRTVLVNRGFVPPERVAAASRPAGVVTVTGLLRLSEAGGAFLRPNDPGRDRWYSRDVAAIARARGLGTVAPYFIDADATANPGGLPIGGLTVIAFRNNHLPYALTWFALAGLTGWAMWRFVRLRREG